MTIADKIAQYQSLLLPFNAQLIAVSKTQPPDAIMEAYEAGQRHFGENYVQELVSKQASLPTDISWHFIGHLQRNKIKHIAPFVHLIHGIDSMKLLTEVDKIGNKINRKISVLLQVHIASEETKFGFDINDFDNFELQQEFKKLENVCIKGLMGMASNTSDSVQVKLEFEKLKMLFEKLKGGIMIENEYFKFLSIGMSNDFQIALETGGNMVRIGSAIFGNRIYG